MPSLIHRGYKVLLFQQDLDDTSRKLLFRLRNDWSDITVDDIDRHQVITEGLTFAPAGYGSALQLARLILLGAAMDSKSGWGGLFSSHQIPMAWNLAGGYQRDSFNEITPVIDLHRQTMYEAIRAVQFNTSMNPAT